MITLGIIGVVAAMTLPSLITKYQRNVFDTAFKKQYSVLNNTINYIQLNSQLSECYIILETVIYEGVPTGMYAGRNSDCSALKSELISDLKLTPITKYSTFTPREKVKEEGGSMVNRTVDYDNIISLADAYLLPDGAVVLFANHKVNRYEDDIIIIDVNGKRGPNKWGYDVYCLTLVSKNGVIRLSDEYASLTEKGGKLPRTILLNQSNNVSNPSWKWE